MANVGLGRQLAAAAEFRAHAVPTAEDDPSRFGRIGCCDHPIDALRALPDSTRIRITAETV